jgi:hypothetical protein
VDSPIPEAFSSNTTLVDQDGNEAFDDDDDEDGVSVAIGFDEDTGMVVINFAEETTWMALSPDNAIDLANAILDSAKDAKLSKVD